MKKNITLLVAGLTFSLIINTCLQAQTVTASSQTKIQITAGASPASLKRKLKEELEIRAVKNL